MERLLKFVLIFFAFLAIAVAALYFVIRKNNEMHTWELPLYPNATVAKLNYNGFVTSDSPITVKEFYEKQFKSAGWHVSDNVGAVPKLFGDPSAEGFRIIFEKGCTLAAVQGEDMHPGTSFWMHHDDDCLFPWLRLGEQRKAGTLGSLHPCEKEPEHPTWSNWRCAW